MIKILEQMSQKNKKNSRSRKKRWIGDYIKKKF